VPHPAVAKATVSAFGGASNHWGAYWRSRPLDALDFEQRDAVPFSGWPFDRQHLVPYYERAEHYLGLPPFDYSAGTEGTDVSRHLPLRPGRLVAGELRYVFGSDEFYLRQYGRLAAAKDTQVVLGAHVSELLADRTNRNRIAGVRALLDRKRSFTITSRLTVLAAGGIGNAKLLLLGNRDAPAGIGNHGDHVGRFFMEHLAVRSGVIVLEDRSLLRRSDLFGIDRSAEATVARTIAPSQDVLREQGLLNSYFVLEPRPAAHAADAVRAASSFWRLLRSRPLTSDVARRLPGAAAATPAVARALLSSRKAPDLLIVRVQAEQAPNPDSRVTLGATRNRLGIPQARFEWRLLPEDTASIRRGLEILAAELESSGLGRLHDLLGDERPAADVSGSYHQLGTTRMSDNPDDGVVDASGRVHGVSDLYVTGGSVFPTVGAANPTLTVIALAVRLADEIARVLGVTPAPASPDRFADSPWSLEKVDVRPLTTDWRRD
jgi:choline dehydrogenase-like flavoprotein